MENWYYLEYGKPRGPVSQKDLVHKVVLNELDLETSVMKDSDQKWDKFKNKTELMNLFETPPVILNYDNSTAANLAKYVDSESKGIEIGTEGTLYFYIPMIRLVTMTLLTVGLYSFYWLYKNWSYVPIGKRSSYSFDREVTGGFTLFKVFSQIQLDPNLNAVERCPFSARTSSTLFVIAFLLDLSIFVIAPVQQYINRVNAKLGNSYSPKTFGHYFCIFCGIITWIGIFKYFLSL